LGAALNQLRPGLRQHLDRNVVRHKSVLDELADESEIRLRCRREADLDLLEAELNQEVEHAALAVRSHRLDQSLVAVAQIDAAPLRRTVDDARRPATVGQSDRRK